MTKRKLAIMCAALLVAGAAVGYYLGTSKTDKVLQVATAEAAGGRVTSPTGTAPDRYVYYPGTEELKPDEIRLIACGTGLPAAKWR
jgi:ribonuclease Z